MREVSSSSATSTFTTKSFLYKLRESTDYYDARAKHHLCSIRSPFRRVSGDGYFEFFERIYQFFFQRQGLFKILGLAGLFHCKGDITHFDGSDVGRGAFNGMSDSAHGFHVFILKGRFKRR